MSNYEIDFQNSILVENITLDNFPEELKTIDAPTALLGKDLNTTYTFTAWDATTKTIDNNIPIFTIKTTANATNIQATADVSDSYLVYSIDKDSSSTTSTSSYTAWQHKINKSIASFVDPSSNLPLFTTSNTRTKDGEIVSIDDDGNPLYFGPAYKEVSSESEQYNDISFNIQINKKLLATQYNVAFYDISSNRVERNIDFNGDNTWRDALYIDDGFCVTSFSDDSSYNLFNSIPSDGNVENFTNSSDEIIGKIDASGCFTAIGKDVLAATNYLTIVKNKNDSIKIIAEENGVVSQGGENNIELQLPAGSYTRSSLLIAINNAISTANTNSSATKVTGGFEIISKNSLSYLNINLTILRNYTPRDFKIVFYDEVSFAQCSAGASSVKNTTWDSTLGWVLGFREYTIYDLSAIGIKTTSNNIEILGDTGVSTQLYNYFLLCIDDYNQNHLNDGLVTITDRDTSIPLPSYANKSEFQCDPVTGETVYNASSGLTGKQVYSAMEIYNSKNATSSIGTSVSTKSYGAGPFVKDVFGIIPLKVSNLVSGSAYTEFGGTLQNQERNYFGPVNLRRMTVQLRTDRGDLVDLNNANWSFSLIAEQLNNNPAS